MSFPIKKGDKFLCTKTVIMQGSGTEEYTKGKVYESEQSGCITDNSNCIGHVWDDRDLDHWNWPELYFRRLHEEEDE